jgi:uracil-DNA glycosylase
MEEITKQNITKLQSLIQKCERCGLYKNGRAMPFIDFDHYKDVMFVLEAPGGKEKEMNTPVVGAAGKKLWSIAEEYNMYRPQFAIINSVNCRPIKVNEKGKISNGKPTEDELKSCYPWLEIFTKLVGPKLIVVFGTYAVKSLLDEEITITRNAGKLKKVKLFNKYYEILYNLHPASLIYGKDNEDKFREGMKILGEKLYGNIS